MTGDIFLLKQDVSGREFCNPTTAAGKSRLASRGERSQLANFYLNSGKRPKRVEIPDAAFGKSLPKQRKSAEKVEIPGAAFGKSLPK